MSKVQMHAMQSHRQSLTCTKEKSLVLPRWVMQAKHSDRGSLAHERRA